MCKYSSFENIETRTYVRSRRFYFLDIRDREMYLGTMNGISLAMTASPLLTMASLDTLEVCNYDNLPARCANSTICSCLHVIVARQNSIVEFVLIDESPGISFILNLV